LAGTRRWISSSSSTWKGHNQISPRHARGGDSCGRAHFQGLSVCQEGGTWSRAIMGLTLGSPWIFPSPSWWSVGCATPRKSSSHPTIQQPLDCAWRDVTWYHAVTPKKCYSSSENKSHRRILFVIKQIDEKCECIFVS